MGALNKKELAEGMNSFGKEFVASEIESVFSLADVNSDGEICYDEFVAMMFPAAASALAKFRKHHRTLKNAKHAFDSYDVDGDGEITYEELVGGMGGDYIANEISAIFAMGDTDQDGKISFLEFSKIMIPSCQDTLHHQDQDHRSPREEVLRLDRRLHPGFPLHLPADVD